MVNYPMQPYLAWIMGFSQVANGTNLFAAVAMIAMSTTFKRFRASTN